MNNDLAVIGAGLAILMIVILADFFFNTDRRR